MLRTILGKVSLTPKGEYSPDTAYTALDVVSYGGSSWLALKDVTGVAPVEGENWMLLAQKGEQGEQGIQGIQGIQGETGGPGPTGPQGASFTRLEKTAGTGAPGTIDTYTAYNSEGQAAGTVQVYNGMDGTGAGDFKADGTVPMTGDLQMAQHKVTGVADATEDGDAVNKGQMDAALEGVTVTTDAAPTEDSTNPVQSGGVYTALAGKADLTLSNLSNRQKALRNIGGRPNRNLLYNWYLVGGGSQQGGGQFPINQRGQTSYTNVNSTMYGIDMWILDWNMTLTLVSGYVSMNGGGIFQPLPNEKISLITGKTVTLSALDAYGNLSVVTGVYDGVNHIISSDGSVGIRINYGGKTAIFRVGRNSVVACKLELGDHQTLAYQDEDGNWQLFETPDYGEELEKCRYYFRRYGVSPLGRIYLPPAMGISGTEASFSIVSEPMRITPTISGYGFILAGISSDGYFSDGNISFSLLGASPLSGIFTIKAICTNRTLVPGNFYVLYANPEYGAYLDLSAEL